LQRVLKATTTTLSVTFTVDGIPTDPSPATATVTITRADGTVIVTSGTAVRTGAGVFTYTLSSAQTTNLDILTAAWTSSLGTISTITEIVGGFLFTIADARADSTLSDVAKYPTALIQAARTVAEEVLERACGVAFVPRYHRETLDGSGTTDLAPSWPRVSSVTAASVDGTALAAGDLTGLVAYSSGGIYNLNGWYGGRGNVTISYTHGYPYAPGRVGLAALKLARRYLVDSPVSDRATSMSTPDGGTQFFVTAGVRSAITDIPEANAVIQEYSLIPAIA